MGLLRRGLRGGRGGGRRRRSNCSIVIISISISNHLIFIIMSLLQYRVQQHVCVREWSKHLPLH